MNEHSISSNLVELLAVDCSDEEAVRELTVLVDPTVEWVKASHMPRSGRQNYTGAGSGMAMYGNGAGSTTNRYSKNYNNKNGNSNSNSNSSNSNSNSNNRNSYGKPSTTYGYNKTVSNAVSGATSTSTAGGASGLGDDSGLSLGEQKVQE